MREFVLLAFLIRAIYAYYDEYPDYLYTIYTDDITIDDILSEISWNLSNSSLNNNLRSVKELHFDLLDSDDDSPSERSRIRNKVKSRIEDIQDRKDRRVKMKFVPFGILKKIFNQRGSLKDAISMKRRLSWPTSGNKECTIAGVRDFECNRCVCATPMLYICSSKICTQTVTKSECVEGTKIKTEYCKECFCIGGRVMCNLLKCPLEKEIKALGPMKDIIDKNYKGEKCIEGLPTKIDSCNTCGCSGGNILCTVTKCSDEVDHVKMKAPAKLDVCQKGTWYCPFGNKCKNCYCVDNHASFCFIGVCHSENENINIKNRALAQKGNGDTKLSFEERMPLYCKPGDKREVATCTDCLCTEKGHWRCTKAAGCESKLKSVSNIDSDVCEEGLSYSIGTKNSCYLCTCRKSSWECSTKKSRCSDYDDVSHKTLKPKTVYVNPMGACSVCYVLKDNICATDITCTIRYYENAKPEGRCATNVKCRKICEAKGRYGSCYKRYCRCF